jgi:hypothetical protein
MGGGEQARPSVKDLKQTHLAAQLEGDLFEIALSGGDGYPPACDDGAGKRYLVDIHMTRDGATRRRSEPGQGVDHSRWETGLFGEVAEV